MKLVCTKTYPELQTYAGVQKAPLGGRERLLQHRQHGRDLQGKDHFPILQRSAAAFYIGNYVPAQLRTCN